MQAAATGRARHRDPARGASRIQWDRVGRFALVLVLAAILASYVKPALNFFDAWRRLEGRARLACRADQGERAAQAACDGVEGPDAAERAARKLGMVAPGEGSYVIRRPLLADQPAPARSGMTPAFTIAPGRRAHAQRRRLPAQARSSWR